MTANVSLDAVDLFCGAGGLTHGLERAGVRVTAGIDVDSACKFPYEANNRAAFRQADVRDVTAEELHGLYAGGDVRILAGCAPCQPFSTYGRTGVERRSASKWELVNQFGRLVNAVQPEIVTMENVPQLPNHPMFAHFLELLLGYSVSWSVVDCAEYGVPQTRKRLVLLASRLGPIKLLPPTEFGASRCTVRSTIGNLPAIAAGQAYPSDPLHTAPRLSELNLRRIRASLPGGTWRDWGAHLVARCHARPSGATYPSVYGRMEWDAPAPTVTTQCFGFGNGRFGHPEQDRAISLREAAMLQTFPNDYQFVQQDNRVRFKVLGRLIGNAVPVQVAEAIGSSIFRHVQSQCGT